MRVQFVHGLESSPQGLKAQYLAQHFEARPPALDTSDFPACVELQRQTIEEFQPDVLVGSSFGGAVCLVLLQRDLWRGPTLLLAQAGSRLGLLAEGIPPDRAALIVHGTRDEVIPVEGSRALARTGTPGRVQYEEVDDTHRLQRLVDEDRLADLVRRAHALGAAD